MIRTEETAEGWPVRVIPWTDRNERAALWDGRQLGADPGEDSHATWARKLASGDLSPVADVERILERTTARLLDARPGREARPDVCGQRLSMGAYLAGAPRCFRRKRRTERGVVHVVLGRTISWTATPAMIQNVGIAALAIVQRLAMDRPVRLSVQQACRVGHYSRPGAPSDAHYAARVELGIAPIDLSELCVALWHPGTKRRWLHAEAEDVAFERYGISRKANSLPFMTKTVRLAADEVHLDAPLYKAGMDTPEQALDTLLAGLKARGLDLAGAAV